MNPSLIIHWETLDKLMADINYVTDIDRLDPLHRLQNQSVQNLNCDASVFHVAEIHVGEPGCGIWRSLERSLSSLPAARTGKTSSTHISQVAQTNTWLAKSVKTNTSVHDPFI